MPCASSADSVLPGLNPYQPNQRIRPPTAPRMMLCGSIGTAAVTLEHAAEPRSEDDGAGQRNRPPMVWTTVDPAKSWNGVGVMTASQPSGPHAQWPMIG